MAVKYAVMCVQKEKVLEKLNKIDLIIQKILKDIDRNRSSKLRSTGHSELLEKFPKNLSPSKSHDQACLSSPVSNTKSSRLQTTDV